MLNKSKLGLKNNSGGINLNLTRYDYCVKVCSDDATLFLGALLPGLFFAPYGTLGFVQMKGQPKRLHHKQERPSVNTLPQRRLESNWLGSVPQSVLPGVPDDFQ